MSTLITGAVQSSSGDVRVWAEGRELARSPVLQRRYEIRIDADVKRVAVEHVLDGEIRRGCVVDLDGPEVEVGHLGRGSTLRAEAWRQTWEHGLGDRSPLIDALLPNEIGAALGAMPHRLRAQARDQLLRTLRVAMHAREFTWNWANLDEALVEHLSPAMRTLLMVGVWRSAMRVSEVDRPLVDLCEPAAAALELRACRLAAHALGTVLEPEGITIPDPGERPVSSWSVAVLFALRGATESTEIDIMDPASLCSEVAIAIDRALDGIVAQAFDQDDPEILKSTLASQLQFLETSLQSDLEGVVHEIPGGWSAIAALWVSTLAGLGFNADIDRSTESYTIPST